VLTLPHSPSTVTIVAKAVSGQTAIEKMWVDSPGSALNTLNHKCVSALQSESERVGKTPDKLGVLDQCTARSVEVFWKTPESEWR
jgi:hypothetical protein